MSFKIEKYSQDTFHRIKDLVDSELSESYGIYVYRVFLLKWPEMCLICYVDKEVAGVILGNLKNSYGYIAMLVVERKFRKRGIGTFLVRKLLSVMKEKGALSVSLEAAISNKAALLVYERCDFFRERYFDNYYRNGEDAYRLRKEFKY